MTLPRRSTRGTLLALLPAVLALQACSFDPFGAAADPDDDLREALARWERQAIRDYRYTVGRTCFCGWEVLGPVRVEVRGGQTVSVTPEDPSVPIRREAFQGLDTVEDMFATIRRAIEGDADDVQARYDPERGYPVGVSIDYMKSAIDDESGFQVRDFQVIQ